MALLSVEEALSRVLDGVAPVETEEVALADCLDRTLAQDLVAARTQPPWDTSAMDGYAVRADDVASVPARLKLIGVASAGHAFDSPVGPGEAVRIFTGAPLPTGADAIVIQENASPDGDHVVVRESAPAGRYVRPRGLDFSKGELLLTSGTCLGPRTIALAASMNFPSLPVRRRPTVAILATGDELVAPGEEPRPDQIIASNSFGLAALVLRAGGWPVDLGIAPDDLGLISGAVRRAIDAGVDVIVTLGGASVGEHDLVHDALAAEGVRMDFWKIAMRPGKPLMFGRLGRTRVLGLPGNPVSSLVCSRIFLMPLLAAFLGRADQDGKEEPALLGAPVPENDQRQEYLRASLDRDEAGRFLATPFSRQDSSMLATLARADCLVVRPPFAAAAETGSPCSILRLEM